MMQQTFKTLQHNTLKNIKLIILCVYNTLNTLKNLFALNPHNTMGSTEKNLRNM